MNVLFLEMSAVWAEVNMTEQILANTSKAELHGLTCFVNREEQLSDPSVKADSK